MQTPVLSEEEKKSLEEVGPRKIIRKREARVRGRGIRLHSSAGLCELIGGYVDGWDMRVFSQNACANVKNSEIVTDGGKIYKTHNTIFGKGAEIYGSDHTIYGSDYTIFANHCAGTIHNSVIKGSNNTFSGTNLKDEGENNTIMLPPPPRMRDIDPHVVDEDMLASLAVARENEKAEKLREKVIPVPDITEEDKKILENAIDYDEKELCLSCFERKRDTKCNPCRHVVLCRYCAHNDYGSNRVAKKCPFCHTPLMSITPLHDEIWV